jgi:signal transduction histidine kinase
MSGRVAAVHDWWSTATRVQVAVYYVVAESFTNAANHAQASELTVTVNLDDENLCLLVRDDGVRGADSKDRVEALGCQLTVPSPADTGTSLTATIPLHHHDKYGLWRQRAEAIQTR